MLESVAQFDSLVRPYILRILPAHLCVKLYSAGRDPFLSALKKDRPTAVQVSSELGKTLWGIKFRSPIFNAAGMFKNAEGYELSSLQGAGAFLAGTSTATARTGNTKLGITHPFIPYPRSHAASNFMGLPNPGDELVADRLSKIQRVEGCPIGVSLAQDPALADQERLPKLLEGLKRFEDAGVDFIELNESCPNTGELSQIHGLRERLSIVSEQFVRKRQRHVPVILKFSTDTPLEAVANLVELSVGLGFDGLNFGNTSTNYATLRLQVAAEERRVFDYFAQQFGGGVSGSLLKQKSLELIAAASEAVAKIKPGQEFHLIRTGGIEIVDDLKISLEAGAALVQWFTGYFEAFAKDGHSLYQVMYAHMSDDKINS